MASKFTLSTARPKGPLALISTPGARELTQLVDKNLVEWYKSVDVDGSLKKDTFVIDASYPRFTNGEGKAMVMETLRGKDLFIISDMSNHGVTYNFYGKEIPMTPDEHFADLKRIICAANCKPERITVVMPMLYEGRQHRRAGRESLDCALMLHELYDMGVSDIITFDAHDPRVQNAVPMMGFDNYFPTYQVLKALTKHFPDVKLDKNSLMCISPDEGAIGRNVYYASVLGLDLGMFYKRRDYASVVNGRNPIIAHEYIGSPVMGMNVFVADDMIATGDSMIKLAREIKEKGAQRVFLSATFSLFTEGLPLRDVLPLHRGAREVRPRLRGRALRRRHQHQSLLPHAGTQGEEVVHRSGLLQISCVHHRSRQSQRGGVQPLGPLREDTSARRVRRKK